MSHQVHLQRVQFPASYVNVRECSETTEADGYLSGSYHHGGGIEDHFRIVDDGLFSRRCLISVEMLPSRNWVGKILMKKDNAHYQYGRIETFFLRDSSQCKNFKRTSSGSPEKTTMSRRNDQQVMMIAMIQLMIALTLLNHDWGVENLFLFGCTVILKKISPCKMPD